MQSALAARQARPGRPPTRQRWVGGEGADLPLLLLLPRSCPAPALLLPCSCPAPALLLPCSCPAPALKSAPAFTLTLTFTFGPAQSRPSGGATLAAGGSRRAIETTSGSRGGGLGGGSSGGLSRAGASVAGRQGSGAEADTWPGGPLSPGECSRCFSFQKFFFPNPWAQMLLSVPKWKRNSGTRSDGIIL